MTSNRSDYEFSYKTVLFGAAIIGLWIYEEVSLSSILFCGAFISFDIYRDHMRRSTMKRREDCVYVWIEWHGGERSSTCDPTDDWDSEGDGDGGD